MRTYGVREDLCKKYLKHGVLFIRYKH
ncbi:hypothetical protein DFAR_630002 [Desulfarculales bacterium]